MISFATIRARAEKRKGGAEALAKLMPPKPKSEALLARIRGHDRQIVDEGRRRDCRIFKTRRRSRRRRPVEHTPGLERRIGGQWESS